MYLQGTKQRTATTQRRPNSCSALARPWRGKVAAWRIVSAGPSTIRTGRAATRAPFDAECTGAARRCSTRPTTCQIAVGSQMPSALAPIPQSGLSGSITVSMSSMKKTTWTKLERFLVRCTASHFRMLGPSDIIHGLLAAARDMERILCSSSSSCDDCYPEQFCRILMMSCGTRNRGLFVLLCKPLSMEARHHDRFVLVGLLRPLLAEWT